MQTLRSPTLLYVLFLMTLMTCSFSVLLCPLNTPFSKRIDSDLAPFSSGITKQMLEETSKQRSICKITFKDQKCHAKRSCSLWPSERCLLDQLALEMPDLQFFINELDQPQVPKNPCKANDSWPACACDKDYTIPNHGFFLFSLTHPITQKRLMPVFSKGTISSCFLDILMPSHMHLNAFPKRKPIPWQQKQFKAIWRGSATGGIFRENGPHFEKYHRHRLWKICQNHTMCDYQFTNLGQCGKVCDDQKIRYGKPAKQQSLYYQSKNKIFIDIDGNTYSGRYPSLLYLGSAVFKIAVFQDIVTAVTEPWVHYVPVKIDLSDFEQKLQWAKEHDEELKRIAKAAREFSMEYLRLKNYKCYMKELLTKYHRLLR